MALPHLIAQSDMLMDGRQISRAFFARMATPSGLEALFDYLPDVYLFVKDRAGRFVRCNRAFVRLAQANGEDDVLGRNDADMFPRHLAENYMLDDRAVMDSGTPIVDKVELVRNADGSIDWYNTTKVPVSDRKGKTIGLAGITRDLKKTNTNNAQFLALAPVLDTIVTDYASPLSISSLARKAALSISQFDRQFKRKFRMAPRRYIATIRIDVASQLLVSTDLSIAEVAQQTGFYDQSHFTNQFVRHKGMPPSHYRTRYAARAGSAAPSAQPRTRTPYKTLRIPSKPKRGGRP